MAMMNREVATAFFIGNFASSTKASEFREAISRDSIQLVDVRTPQEYNQGAIDGAVNIDYFNQSAFDTSVDQLDRDRPVYLYCRSGNRSQKAAKKLIRMGFTEIYDLQGGYSAYRD